MKFVVPKPLDLLVHQREDRLGSADGVARIPVDVTRPETLRGKFDRCEMFFHTWLGAGSRGLDATFLGSTGMGPEMSPSCFSHSTPDQSGQNAGRNGRPLACRFPTIDSNAGLSISGSLEERIGQTAESYRQKGWI